MLALLLFNCVLVAEELLSKKSVRYKDSEMSVSLYDEPQTEDRDSPADGISANTDDDDDPSDVVLVRVSEIPLGLSEDMIRMIFEKECYGGGDIKTFELSRSDNTAVIQFESSTGNTLFEVI